MFLHKISDFSGMDCRCSLELSCISSRLHSYTRPKVSKCGKLSYFIFMVWIMRQYILIIVYFIITFKYTFRPNLFLSFVTYPYKWIMASSRRQQQQHSHHFYCGGLNLYVTSQKICYPSNIYSSHQETFIKLVFALGKF